MGEAPRRRAKTAAERQLNSFHGRLVAKVCQANGPPLAPRSTQVLQPDARAASSTKTGDTNKKCSCQWARACYLFSQKSSDGHSEKEFHDLKNLFRAVSRLR